MTIERIAYDALAVAAEVRDRGLPGEFADKLVDGRLRTPRPPFDALG